MKIALVGNQNSGKSTLFNLLTGGNQKIGNWPGVTVEGKIGKVRSTNHEIIDLPGVYSLSPVTTEEHITRFYLLEEKPDLMINVIDVNSFERSLYLTMQLLELDIPIIIVLNMIDLSANRNIKINHESLESELGVKTFKVSATTKVGFVELLDYLKTFNKKTTKKYLKFNDSVETIITNIAFSIKVLHSRFISIKILENDKNFSDLFPKDIDAIRNNIFKEEEIEIKEFFANERYKYITKLKHKIIDDSRKKLSFSEHIDDWLINRFTAIPIFGLVMFLVYFLSVGVVGNATVDIVDNLISNLQTSVGLVLESLGASPWSQSLVVDGMIAGVGAVLTFVPQLTILFTLIALLEKSGYMSRVAFILDRVFRKVGLSGKALIPFIIGSGCSVPAIMATRTIDDEKERKMTAILTPFIPCSAKLPIIAVFASYFFTSYSGVISASIYFLAVLIVIISAYFMQRIFKPVVASTFIAELVDYKLPNFKQILIEVYENVSEFIKKAGSIILLSSILIWFLLSFTSDFTLIDGVSKTINDSLMARLGNSLSFIFYPIVGDFNWALTVSAIQGLVAKEQVVSSMMIISNLSEETLSIFSSPIFKTITPAAAYAFMVFNLFSAPCFASIGAMRRELGSWKQTVYAALFQTITAYLLAVIIFIALSI